ncbi:MAG: helix-turn-helix domain-containing protein [Lysobacterales bacterium]
MSARTEHAISRLRVARTTQRLPADLAEEVEQLLRFRDGDILRQREAARVLSVSERTLRNWQQRGVGPPCRRAGRSIFYSAESLRAWASNREHGSVFGK